MKPDRPRRVGELIKRELALILNLSKQDYPGFFITVTEVRTSPDLRYADAWVSVYGDNKKRLQAIKNLTSDAWRFRQALSKKLHLRRIPELRFKLDETLDKAERIERLLKENLPFEVDTDIEDAEDIESSDDFLEEEF